MNVEVLPFNFFNYWYVLFLHFYFMYTSFFPAFLVLSLSHSLYTETGVRGNFESPCESWITRPRTSGRADSALNCWNIAPAFTFCDLLKLKEFKKVSWHVLILFFTERYSMLWWPRTWDQIDQGPKIKPNTPSLLKEQSVKRILMTFCYTQISALLNCHQRCFLLNKNKYRDPPRGSVQYEQETLEHSLLNGVSTSNPSPQGSGTLGKRRQQECKCQKGGRILRKQDDNHSRADGHMNSQKWRKLAQGLQESAPEGTPMQREVNTNPSLIQKWSPTNNHLQMKI